MILVSQEAQNLPQASFSCILIPFSFFLFKSDERQSAELTPIGTGKQSDDFGSSPFSLRNVAVTKSVIKNLVWTFLSEIGDLTKSALLERAYRPPQVQFYDSGPMGGTKPKPNKVFLHADSIFNVFI